MAPAMQSTVHRAHSFLVSCSLQHGPVYQSARTKLVCKRACRGRSSVKSLADASERWDYGLSICLAQSCVLEVANLVADRLRTE